MTVRERSSSGREHILRPGRFHFTVARLCGRARLQESGGVHQIVGDDSEADPAIHAVGASIATAAKSMSSFEHTDAPFAPDAPALRRRNQRWCSWARRAGDVEPRRGRITRRTPRSRAACSLLAELKPRCRLQCQARGRRSFDAGPRPASTTWRRRTAWCALRTP